MLPKNPTDLLLVLIFAIVLTCFFSYYGNLVQGTSLKNYQNVYMGIKFMYPSSWHVDKMITSDGADCFVYPFGVYHFCQVAFDASNNCCDLVSVTAHKMDECSCNSLKEFVKWSYGVEVVFVSTSVISDSPVTISGNRSAWEMESAFSAKRSLYSLWIINDDMGYFISLATDTGKQYNNYLKSVKDMINTVEFIPVSTPTVKTPSFMN